MLLLLIIKVVLSVPLKFSHPAVELGKLCQRKEEKHVHT